MSSNRSERQKLRYVENSAGERAKRERVISPQAQFHLEEGRLFPTEGSMLYVDTGSQWHDATLAAWLVLHTLLFSTEVVRLRHQAK